MATIYEVIRPYLVQPGEDSQSALRKYFTWRNALATADREPELKWFFDLLELAAFVRYPTAETFLALLSDMGFDVHQTDFEDFIEQIRCLGRTRTVRLNRLPRFPFDLYTKYKNELEEIGQDDLGRYVESISWVEDPKVVHYADSRYYVSSKATFDKIKSDYVAHYLPYTRVRRDCDDFALLFRAFLAQHNLGNYAAAIMWAAFYDPDRQRAMGHAVNLVIYRNERGELNYLIYEPQTKDTFYVVGTERDAWEQVKPHLIVF